MCLTPSRHAVRSLSPAARPLRSADHKASGDLCRHKRWAALAPQARRHTKPNEPRCDARTPLSRRAGVDLTTIEESEETPAFILRSAIGTDMPRGPSVQPFWSWLGL